MERTGNTHEILRDLFLFLLALPPVGVSLTLSFSPSLPETEDALSSEAAVGGVGEIWPASYAAIGRCLMPLQRRPNYCDGSATAAAVEIDAE
jgi:hypothetical protein